MGRDGGFPCIPVPPGPRGNLGQGRSSFAQVTEGRAGVSDASVLCSEMCSVCEAHSFLNTFFAFPKEKSVLEEMDVIVASLLDTLLRTILEITSRPQPSGSAMRLQFQDVTVRP